MSDFDSSSEYLARAADSAGEGRLTFRSVFLGLVVLYVVIAAVSIGVLIFKVPVSAEELKHATWLVFSPPIYTAIFGALSGLWLLLYMQMIRPMTLGLGVLMVSFVAGVSSSPSVSFRSAVLAGEAKIGCYEYANHTCSDIQGLSSSPASLHQSGRAARHLIIPVEVMAFLRAPFDVFRADRLNHMLDRQRLELAEEIHKGLMNQSYTPNYTPNR